MSAKKSSRTPISRSRRPPPPVEAGEGKGSEEEDVEDADQVSLQTAAAAQGKASTVSPNIEDVISIHSLSEIERQTIVEIVSSFPNLTEGQLKSIEVLVQSTQLSKQSIMSLVIHGAAAPVSGSPPVLSAELEKKFTNISNLMSKASDEQIKGKLRKVLQSLVEAGQSNVCGNVALTQEHLKRLDEAFEEITNVRQLTNTPSATLSNFTKLTPAGAATLLGRNSMSSFGGHGGEASSASSAGSSQRVRFPVPETLQESEKRREQREVDGKKDDLSRSNLPVFVSVNSPLNLRRENLGDQAFEPVRMAAHNLAVAAAEYCYVNMTAHTLLTYMIVAAVNKQIHRFYNLAGGMLVEMGYPPARSVVDNLEKLKAQDEEIRSDIMCLQNANDMAAYHLASISGLFLGAAGVIFSNGFDNTALSKEACRMVAKVYNFDFGDDVTQFQRQLNGFVKVVEQAQMMTLNLDDHKKINPALNATNTVAVAMASFGAHRFTAYDVGQAKFILRKHSNREITSLVVLQAILAEAVAQGYFISSDVSSADAGEPTTHALAAATASASSAAASAASDAKSAKKKKKSKAASPTAQTDQRGTQHKVLAASSSGAVAVAASAAPVAVSAPSRPPPAAPPKKPYKPLSLKEKEERNQQFYNRNVAKTQEVLQRSGKNPDDYLDRCVLNGEYTHRWRPGAPTFDAASASSNHFDQLAIRAVQSAFDKGAEKYLGDQYAATLVSSASLGATGAHATASATAPPHPPVPPTAPPPAHVPHASVFSAPSSQQGMFQQGMGTPLIMVPVPMPGVYHSGAQGGTLQMQMPHQSWQQGQFYSQQPPSRHALAAQGLPLPPGYGMPMGYQGMVPHLGHPSVDQRLLQAPREIRDKEPYDVCNEGDSPHFSWGGN